MVEKCVAVMSLLVVSGIWQIHKQDSIIVLLSESISSFLEHSLIELHETLRSVYL